MLGNSCHASKFIGLEEGIRTCIFGYRDIYKVGELIILEDDYRLGR